MVIEVAQMSEDDLALLADFLSYLKTQHAAKTSVTDIRTQAIQRANALRNLPREERKAQFREALNRVRADAAAKGEMIEGEWRR